MIEADPTPPRLPRNVGDACRFLRGQLEAQDIPFDIVDQVGKPRHGEGVFLRTCPFTVRGEPHRYAGRLYLEVHGKTVGTYIGVIANTLTAIDWAVYEVDASYWGTSSQEAKLRWVITPKLAPVDVPAAPVRSDADRYMPGGLGAPNDAACTRAWRRLANACGDREGWSESEGNVTVRVQVRERHRREYVIPEALAERLARLAEADAAVRAIGALRDRLAENSNMNKPGTVVWQFGDAELTIDDLHAIARLRGFTRPPGFINPNSETD